MLIREEFLPKRLCRKADQSERKHKPQRALHPDKQIEHVCNIMQHPFFSQIVQNKIWKCSANFSAFYRSALSIVSWDQYYRNLLLNLPCKLRIQNCEMVVNVTNNVSIRDSLENCVLSCENYAELLKNYHFWNDVEMMM